MLLSHSVSVQQDRGLQEKSYNLSDQLMKFLREGRKENALMFLQEATKSYAEQVNRYKGPIDQIFEINRKYI